MGGRVRLLILAVILLAGCVHRHTSPLLDYPDARGYNLQKPPASQALVVFVRPEPDRAWIYASAILHDNREFIGLILAEDRLEYLTTPGTHRFMVSSESADFLDAELLGGRIYFVEVRPRAGAGRQRFSMFPITPTSKNWSKLPQWLERTYRVTPNAAATAWYERNADTYERLRERNIEKWLAKPERPSLAPEDGVPGL